MQKVIIGDINVNNLYQDKYKVKTTDYKVNFLNWEFNTAAGHDVEITHNKLVIKKFMPNEWIVRSNDILPANTVATMCQNITDYAYGWEVYFKNISRYKAILSTYKEAYNKYDIGDSCNMRGVCIYPQRVTDGLWLQQVSAVWEHLGHDGGYRNNGNGYNTYGFFSVGDGKQIVLNSKLTNLSNTWSDEKGVRYAIAICTGYGNRIIQGVDWIVENGSTRVNEYKCTVTKRQAKRFLYSNNTSGKLTIRVSGMKEGDKIYYGNTTTWTESLPTLTSDGELTVTPSNNYGFYLINDSDSTITNTVTVDLVQNRTWQLNNGNFATTDASGNTVVSDVVTMTNNIIDISENPIEIELPNLFGVDVSNVECWNAYLGNDLVYSKPKTVENCWKKYGFAKESTLGFLAVGDYTENSPYGGLRLPIVSDWDKYIQTEDSCIVWRTQLRDTSVYDTFREWYKTHDLTLNTMSKQPFINNNFNGELTVNLNITIDGKTPHHYLTWIDAFSNSGIEKVHFHSKNGCRFSVGQNMFRRAYALKEVSFENDNGDYMFGATDHSGMFEFCYLLKTYSNKLINWSYRLAPDATLRNTHVPYMFELSGIEVVPSYYEEEEKRYADENVCVVGPFAAQMFNSCNNLTKIGPVLDMVLVKPTDGNAEKMFSCVNLQDCRIKRLNHYSWRFDNKRISGGDFVGYLPNLNQESVRYLFYNLMDLNLYDETKLQATIYNSFISWSSSYKGISPEENENWKTYVMYNYFVTRKRFANGTNADSIVYTSQDFGVKTMKINVSGLQDGDRLEFGNGIIARTSQSITTDGEYTLSKNNEETYGFKLYSDNVDNVNSVTVTVLNAYDTTIPRVNAASLYCPIEWSNKITNDMIASANAKNWTIYIDGVEKTIS